MPPVFAGLEIALSSQEGFCPKTVYPRPSCRQRKGKNSYSTRTESTTCAMIFSVQGITWKCSPGNTGLKLVGVVVAAATFFLTVLPELCEYNPEPPSIPGVLRNLSKRQYVRESALLDLRDKHEGTKIEMDKLRLGHVV